MEIVIVGGGIGGLATALSLHGAGVPCRVYESVERIEALGVGINLLPHAVRVLSQLGLGNAIQASGIATQELIYFNKFGQQIWREPRGIEAGYDYPQVSIHRGDLQTILLDATLERLGPEAVVTGAHLQDLDVTTDGQVAATFVDRRSGQVVHNVRADALIAADGIHSAARKKFYPDEGPPIWNGAVLWRGLTQSPPFLTGRSMFMAGHQDQKFVCYPVSQSSFEAGGSLTNIIAELRFPADEPREREDWNRAGKLEDFLPQFESWKFDWLDIPGLIRQTGEFYEYPMVDRDPLPRWTQGPITLLGDAAHPMYPIGSNGASQAIVDASVITRELSATDDPEAAFSRYEAERREATGKIVLANRSNGPEQVMQLAEERAPDGFSNIDDVVPLSEREAIANRYKAVAGFTKSNVNT